MDQSKALFIGYCALPINLHPNGRSNFLDDQIGTLFSNYRNGLKDNSPDESYSASNFFKPTYYYLWGKYDVCVVSEIDDFEFATRFFRPFNPIVPDANTQNFDYKVITGINPLESEDYNRKLPYIGITQLKINSAVQIGNGLLLVSSIMRQIVTLIHELIQNSSNEGLDIQYKITESFSYHELVLVLHSNSLTAIKSVITKTRNLNISELPDADLLVYNSILEDLTGSSVNGKITNHLFESTYTTLGVDRDLYDHPLNLWTKELPNKKAGVPLVRETISFISRWNVKPGHCKMVSEIVQNCKEQYNIENIFAVAGRGDIMITGKIEIDDSRLNSSFNPLNFPGGIFSQKDFTLEYHVIETLTTIGFDFDEISNKIDYSTHKDIHGKLTKFQIPQKTIEDAIYGMRTAGVPKVLSEKVLKLISNYNNAVVNPDMYASFVELYFYISQNFLETISKYAIDIGLNASSSRILIEKLESGCTALEISFQNRFYQSYWMSEVLEINIDYSGGVHNLISAYDSCFKELNNALRPSNRNASFVCVKSDHKVLSYAESLLLNYLHISQPYIFCAIAIYESLNFIVEKWYYSEKFDKSLSTKDEELLRSLELYFSVNIDFKGDYGNPPIKHIFENGKKLLTKSGALGRLEEANNQSDFDFSSFINEKTFRYFITDYINFSCTYERDFNLFCKTTWLYIIQLGNIYERINEINDNVFITVSIRLSLIGKFSQAGNADIYPVELLPLLRNKIRRFKPQLTLFLNLFVNDVDFKNWFLEFTAILDRNSTHIMPALLQNDRHEKLMNGISNYLFNESNAQIEDLLNQIRSSDLQDDDFPYIYTAIIRGHVRSSSQNIGLLSRSHTDGKPTFNESDNDKYILIDPFGGTFVRGEENRRRYLLSRVKFIRLLTHLASLQKKRYVSKILSTQK